MELGDYIHDLEALGRSLGLEHYPVEFELVPPSFMMEIAVYGLPVRMPHWSFGKRWIYQMVQHRMGHSRIFEVVLPGDPNRAYLLSTNSLEENILVVAHVLGHADFSHNNLVFARSQEQVGYHIVEQAASHARRIQEMIEELGQQRVEQVLDVALSLEAHIDSHQGLHRGKYRDPRRDKDAPRQETHPFQARFAGLPGEDEGLPKAQGAPASLRIPPAPEYDLLWFIAHHAPEMEDWERDIFLAVRQESFYFQPVFNCQIMNEGWASYWHSRLLREAGFLSSQAYVDCMKTHSDVVRPHAGEHQAALQINPYHVGYRMWEKLVEQYGDAGVRRIMKEEDDFGFIRNHLDADLAGELDLFLFSARENGEIRVRDSNLHELHEAILAPRYNFGVPRVAVTELKADGALVLRHDHGADGRGLDVERARRVLEYVGKIWRRPVSLITAERNGREVCLRNP